MKPLLCVRHQATAPLGIIEGVLDEQAVEWRYFDAWRESSWPRPSEASGLIVLGGEMSAGDVGEHSYLDPLRDLVRDSVEADLPVLGICLGAQILARALDADVYRAPVKEIGWKEVRATGVPDPVLDPFAPRSRVFQFHEDTFSLPAGADLLFSGEDVAVQAFRVGDRIYGVQFHFEVTTAEIEAWCDETTDLEQSWGISKREVMAQADAELATQQAAGREVARRFADIVLAQSRAVSR